MDILGLRIVKRPKLKPIERKLELDHFYTFKDGTNIYTYKVADLAKISGRYLDKTKNTLNFMLQYAAGEEQIKAWAKNVKEQAKSALEGKKDRTEALAKIMDYADQLPRLQEYVEDLESKKWYDLYEMFFVLEGEQECYFSEKWNARKRELLDKEPDEVKELFFSFLETLMTHFSTTYKNDLIASMVREREMAELAASLTSLTNKANMKSTSADGQELPLSNTGTTTSKQGMKSV